MIRPVYLHCKARTGGRPRNAFLAAVSLILGTLLAPGAAADQPEGEDPYRLLDDLGQAVTVVEEEYFEPVDRADLLAGALRGMVAELDPHSVYFTREDLEIFEGDTSGQFGGIGVEVDFDQGEVVVIAPIEGSPAARAGIEPGDLIVAVDGEQVHGQKPADLVRHMRGAVGSKVTLTLRTKSDSTLRDVVLTRERISVASVLPALLPGAIGYVRIKAFQEGTHEELLKAIGAMRREAGDLNGFILDLRNDPGGLVREAVAVADEFLTSGNIYSARTRGKTVRSASAHRGGAFARGPMVVLINEYSASAAELVAGALRDHGRAQLVGARTFGKGSVQTVVPLGSGGALKLTTALYYTPSGETLQALGVMPHVEVDPGYLEGSRFRVLRESDLSGHIARDESSARKDEPEGAGTRGAPPTNDELHLGVARKVVGDPTDGPDRALSVAYQVVRGELAIR